MANESGIAGDALKPASYRSGFVEAGGRKLHYLDYGTAGRPPMLCIHGGAANGHWYDFVAPSFSPHYHVRALDLRGHGDSEWAEPPDYSYESYASDVAEVAERLDLRDFVLIGHSMGGMVSLVHAATHPGRVGRLIIVDTSMNLSAERLSAMRDVGNRQGSSFATQEDLVERFKLRPGTSQAPRDIVRHIARVSSHQGPDGAWRHKFDRNVYATRASMNGLPLWDRIKIPSLLVRGDNSPRITPEIAAEAQSRCPQLEVASVARSDHHVTLDNPTGFVEAVSAFLAARRT